MANWKAPYRSGLTPASKPINAQITIPGSKSATNRALILAALAKTPSRLRRPLSSRDTDLMVKGLQSLGIEITVIKTKDGFDYEVVPNKMIGPASIDVGNAGTVMRFVPPLAALSTGVAHFDGDARARNRPMKTLIDSLKSLNISVDDQSTGSLPFSIASDGVVMRKNVSSP